MRRRAPELEYYNRPVIEYILENTPDPPNEILDREFIVYIMGPYTVFDARYAFDDADKLASPYMNDPLFDPNRHITDSGKASMEMVLRDICQELRTQFGVRAFIATDVELPTKRNLSEWGVNVDNGALTPIDQSVMYAAVSDAVGFVFTEGGRINGVSGEAGAILGEFDLRGDSPGLERKPRQRFRIFTGGEIDSATLEELPSTYGIDEIGFDDQNDLTSKLQQFMADVEREAESGGHFPIYSSPNI